MTLRQPNPEMQAFIRKKLNENVNTTQENVQHIKDWLAKQPHLPNFDDDQRITTFLRGCKFSLEKTKRKLDMFFTMRAAVPDFFNDRDVARPALKDILDFIYIPPLPGLTPNGCRVIVMRARVDEAVLSYNVMDVMKLVFMIGDIRLKEEDTGVAGDVYILDASIATPAHFAKFTPAVVKKFLVCVQEAYPVKLKQVHVVNVSPIVDSIISFVKPFLKEKIRNRIYVHAAGLQSLHKYIPKDILPEEYGGFAGPLESIHAEWVEKMLSYREWFKEQETVKANESKRPGKPKTHDDLFGLEGSFRQLVID
ncbi:alpha-tocopherol transfer protein-like isoform X2 [Zootermopsis nevadensis]|nr:alpha-tocopherol transfer protein-like isoform X2 [Zootermopsis nevadensis]XP_021933627.1 alpha-tocopherol transfer protein-like isoform X2 [Zootermopsis nevadensis]